MKELYNCPICSSSEFDRSMKVKDYSTSQEEFTICKCEDCDFLFTNPIPNEKAIGRYYENPNYISHTNSSSGLFGRTYQFFRNRALRKKLEWISTHKSAGKIVDYGSGTGEFLNYCKAKGWSTKGYEIAEQARLMARKNYGLDVNEPKEFKSLTNESIDVITLWHVLEHLPDLQTSFELLASKLKVDGLLVLALPNPDSWDAKHYGKFWAAWDVPIHFYHFKKQDIQRLADQHQLELVETIKMPFDSYYVSLLSEEYKGGSKNWFKAAYNGLKSNLKAGKENSSSLTYILKKA
jgi:SAM-dependent methyltransferase